MKLIFIHGVNFGIYWAVLGEGIKVGWVLAFGFIVGGGILSYGGGKSLILSPLVIGKV